MPEDSGNGRKWDLRWKKMKGNKLNLGESAFLYWIIRVVLGLTFIFASWHKMINPADFAKIIYGYGVFPEISINFIAIFLPYIEFMAGICLITGILPGSSLFIINALLTAFIFLIGFNLLRGHQFDCGCFSVSDTQGITSAWSLLIRDFFLLIAGVYLWKKIKYSGSGSS